MSKTSSWPLPSLSLAWRGLPSTKQLIVAASILCVAALAFMQWRSWQTFDWKTFATATRGLSWTDLTVATVLSLLTFPLRAWRWQIFLRPMRRATFSDVLAPTLIGFTGLAVLGRPGELVRPYMIAKRTQLSMASQIGVWTVERIFDMGAFAVMAAVDFVFARGIPSLRNFRVAVWACAVLLLLNVIGAIAMCRWRDRLFALSDERLASRWLPLRGAIRKAHSFAEGLHTIKDVRSFLELSALSLSIWLLTAFAYVATLHAYPALRTLSFSSALLLMGFSMVGGLVQLPAVGGGAQLATIVAMVHILGLPQEISVSAGILLWLVSFHAVTPIGLMLCRRPHLCLRARPQESSRENAPQTAPEQDIPTAFPSPWYQESGNA